MFLTVAVKEAHKSVGHVCMKAHLCLCVVCDVLYNVEWTVLGGSV